MRNLFASVALIGALTAPAAFAETVAYEIDGSHSQIVFGWSHLGFSTTYAMFSGFGGEIEYDEAAPAESSVEVSIPTKSMFTGWEARYEHMMSGDFFDAGDEDMISFVSTGIEVTGETTGKITGDLTVGDVTHSVVLDAVLNKNDTHPMTGKENLGFDATTTFNRSDLGLGGFVPAVGDEVTVMISIEAFKK